MHKRLWTICFAFLAAGCQPALKPDFGYPADWPSLTTLGPGCNELNGTYANDGIATTAAGGFVTVRLARLLPEGRRRGEQTALPTSAAQPGSVVLEVVSAERWQPYPSLRATVTHAGGVQVHEVQAGSDRNALLYLLQLEGDAAAVVGFDAGQASVLLTRGVDGSLVAKITRPQAVVTSAEVSRATPEVWARFERLSP